MRKNIIISSLCTVFLLTTASFSLAREVSKALQCPPGWTEKENNPDEHLLKKCISPAHDAFVELYRYPEMGLSVKQILDGWTAEMSRKGMPLQNMVSESEDEVSGSPALTRTYEGSTGSGTQFSSIITCSGYKDKNYILLGMNLTGHQVQQQEVMHTMSVWRFPGQAESDATDSGDSGSFKNIGACWAWGHWKDAAGNSILILPDGRIVFNGSLEKRWRQQNEDSIVVELSPELGGGTAVWSHPEGRNDAIIRTVQLNEQPDIKPILLRAAWQYKYKGESFRACQH
ncbi:hypothetical protein [Maridesulfovibrio sp. FT414]|uniref:hypothetical protein n=1 Tax=Maridesulfovibrio sp. FT414 TaxID=2979469 RepID=UPI003D801CBA